MWMTYSKKSLQRYCNSSVNRAKNSKHCNSIEDIIEQYIFINHTSVESKLTQAKYDQSVKAGQT